MSDVTRESLDLDDEDRLPWLESAEDYDDEGEYSPARVILFVIFGLALLAAIVGGIYWLQNRDGGAIDGDGTLIAAQEGDYKVRPADTQARIFEGDGDASFAASEGQETPARMGTAEPIETPLKKPEPDAATVASGPMIQLGAFSSAAQADKAWSGLSQRFTNIGALPKKIVQGSVEGSTIYRLNAIAPNAAAAQQACNSMKAAGESCLVVN